MKWISKKSEHCRIGLKRYQDGSKEASDKIHGQPEMVA